MTPQGYDKTDGLNAFLEDIKILPIADALDIVSVR